MVGHLKPFFLFYKYSCNFGLEDRTNILLADMQKLLLSTQQKCMQRKRNDTTAEKKGRKSLSEFPKSSQHSQPKSQIGKTMSSMSIKQGYQKTLIAKQPYLDLSLCQLIYLHGEHKNK